MGGVLRRMAVRPPGPAERGDSVLGIPLSTANPVAVAIEVLPIARLSGVHGLAEFRLTIGANTPMGNLLTNH